MEIRRLSTADIGEAAELMAMRYARHRHANALLSSEPEASAGATRLIEDILAKPQAAGFAAVVSGRITAYLIGFCREGDSSSEPTGIVPLFGCACSPSSDPVTVAHLYAEIGRHWVESGVFSHQVSVLSSDERTSHLWFSLGFGIEQVHAIINLKSRKEITPSLPPGVVVRRVTTQDSEELARLSDVVWSAQIEAPVWAPTSSDDAAEIQAGWRALPAQESRFVFGAFRGDELLGMQLYAPVEHTARTIHLPKRCILLAVAGTKPAARRMGINSALTEYGFSFARSRGFAFCETDWRSANPWSSTFWPHRGFQPYAYRLARRIDTGIAASVHSSVSRS